MNQKICLPNQNICSGCMACYNACPSKAIFEEENKNGEVYPKINDELCIHCGKCMHVCHLNNNFFHENRSNDVYAAWNTNCAVRLTSASGGVAAALYAYALEREIHTFGVAYSSEKGAYYIEIHDQKELDECRNSKYVYSKMGYIYGSIEQYLKKGEQVMFIGLPCHVAGVLSYIGKTYENLLTVDIVCHGTCSEQYLKEHIQYIENKLHKKANAVSFRDPQYGTNQFIFSLRNQQNLLYKAPVEFNDAYQVGYHKAVIYRENCYQCKYARPERISDITISDFSGLGQLAPWEEERGSVSCVIPSTEKGDLLLKTLKENGKIDLVKRNPDEAYKYEKQLIEPSIPSEHRTEFLRMYADGVGFDRAIKISCKRDIRRYYIRHILHVKKIIIIVRKMVPEQVKKILKSRRKG